MDVSFPDFLKQLLKTTYPLGIPEPLKHINPNKFKGIASLFLKQGTTNVTELNYSLLLEDFFVLFAPEIWKSIKNKKSVLNTDLNSFQIETRNLIVGSYLKYVESRNNSTQQKLDFAYSIGKLLWTA